MTENSKFKVGDKVIAVKDTPQNPEGWIGYITNLNPGTGAFDFYAQAEEGGEEFAFDAHELELLRANIGIPNGLDSDDIKPQDIDPQKETKSALDKQVSGNHYKDCGIQPIEYIHANNLSYLEGNVIKYTTRHSKKNKEQDVLKAIHYLELILELEYNYSDRNKT